jgi:signal transduction histidine kinase
MKAEDIQGLLDHAKDEVLMLSRLPALLHLVDLQAGADPDLRRRLVAQVEENFLAFSQAHEAYYQVRYIDERGRETVRADFDGHASLLVPPDRLQDKSHRYYFQEAMEVAPGEVYVSPMDLNVERGEVEVPHKPVVRYATALVNSRGDRKGTVIINIHASRILSEVMALGQEKGDVSLVNSAGFYLSRSEWTRADRISPGPGAPPFPSWLASYSQRLRPRQELSGLSAEEWLLSDLPSGLAATILSGKTGTVVEPGLRGRIVAFSPIFTQQDRQREFWVLVRAYGKTEVLSSIRSLQILVLVLGGGVLVVALVMGVVAARRFTRPITELIRGAEAVAAGDFDRPIRVETNDELEDLSHQFVRMATHLKEHQRQLREARERAERKALETQALNRIGMEVLALLSLPQILQLAVDKARELLKGDLAILCLSAPGEGIWLGAVSGATECLQVGPGDPLPARTCEKVLCHDDPCAAVLGAPFPSHVAVPMRSEDREVGYLCVASRQSRSVGPDELEFLSGLANQATIAIENARLHREVKDLARLEERERIGQDLHDGIIQSIYVTGLGLEECMRLVDEAPGEVKTRLKQLIDGLNVVIRDESAFRIATSARRWPTSPAGSPSTSCWTSTSRWSPGSMVPSLPSRSVTSSTSPGRPSPTWSSMPWPPGSL